MNLSTPSRDVVAARSWFAVVRAYQACERQYARLLGHFDLTIAQYDVLSAIDELGEQATPARIAGRLLVTKGNISGLMQRLADRGLVRLRRHDHDGRSVCVSLEPEAVALLAQARRASAAFIEQQLSPFSAAELAATGKQMERMREHLDTLDPAALAHG